MRPHHLAAAIILLCAAVLVPGRSAHAEDYFDPFTVKEVPVDVTADTAANARNIAIGQAQDRALDVLLRRMTLKEDRARLPHLDGNSVSRLVQSLEFADERYSSTRYIAKVTVTFNAAGIRALLGRTGIAFAEAPEHPVVVLPVFDQNVSESSPWWNAWARQDWQENLLSIALPRAADVLAAGVSPAEMMQSGGPWVGAVGRRYDTSEVLVASASLRTDGGVAKLSVDTKQYGVAGERADHAEFVQQPGESTDALMMRAARSIGNDLTSDWKRNAMIGQGPQSQIMAICDLSSLQDLITVRDRLKRAPMIKSAEVESLAVNRAKISLTVTVPPEQLATAMVQYGIDLTQQNGDWYVAARR